MLAFTSLRGAGMENEKGCFQTIWAFLRDQGNANAVALIIAAITLLVSIVALTWHMKRKKPPNLTDQTLQDYTDRIVKKLSKKKAELKKLIKARDKDQETHDKEKARLWQQIEELSKRAANPEQALKEALKKIAKLKAALAHESNNISEKRMAKARTALEAGDFSIADEIFAEIEDHETLAVERAARAVFARGEIAKQEIRWADAAKHYARAARLHPTYVSLYSAHEFVWRNGDYTNAFILGEKLIEAAKTEYGEQHEKYAEALNQHALTLYDKKRYDLAEALYLKALEIDRQTIGEEHPEFGIHLHNLALLYKAMEKYDKAERYFLQSLKICKKTIGEKHPEYATHLSNLAGLYRAIEEYDKAEDYYRQALEICEQTIGQKHPDYATYLNNLASLHKAKKECDQAEPLYLKAIQILEVTLGPDHPNTKTCKGNYGLLQKSRKE